MPRYLVQLAYTSGAWAAQLRNPQDRIEVVRPALEQVGGRFEATYFAFGEYDVVLIVEAPDNTAVAAFGMAVAAGGAVKRYTTTPLLTVEEGLEALRRGAEVAQVYRPPAG